MAEDQPSEFPATSGRDVFISYASQDKAVADAICEALERAGIVCWIAPRDVTPGEFYAESIVHAIDSTKVIVLVLSQHSADSQHVLREVERASSKRHPVVSFRLDSAPLPAGLEYFLNSSQWLDASTTGAAGSLPRLVDAVKTALSQPVTPARTAAASPAITRSIGRGRPALIALAVLATAALAYLTLTKLWLPKPAPAPSPVTSPSAATAAIPDKSIAVLPFTDMSEKKDQEYFGDGMAEEILDLLVQIPQLTVIGRTSSFQFKGKSEDLRTIGERLNAAYVLEGSVRKAGNRVRVTAQLIETRTGAHQWSQTYDRDFSDALKVQDDIALAVSQAMRLVLRSPLPARSSVKNADAYRLYLQGLFLSNGDTKTHAEQAIAAYRASLALDPDYAPAWAQLSGEFQDNANLFNDDARQAYAAARDAAQRALDLDPSAIDGYLAMAGVYLWFDWDWARAKQVAERARHLQSDDVRVLGLQGAIAFALGEWDEAIAFSRQAVARDPLSDGAHYNLALAMSCRGELSESEAEFRKALQLSPESGETRVLLAKTLMLQGRLAEALTVAQQEPNQGDRLWVLTMIYHAMGRNVDSDRALAEKKRLSPSGDEGGIAWDYAVRGELDHAFAWFERAYDRRSGALAWIKCMPEAPAFTRDPRYKALLRKMNLPE